MTDIKRLVSDVTAAPLGEIIAAVGDGVATAQRALDDQAIQQVLALYADGDEAVRLLRESGWRPTFYAIPEAEGEIKVSLVVSGSTTASRSTGAEATTVAPRLSTQPGSALLAGQGRMSSMLSPKLYATPVDAGYQNRYDFEGSVSATVKFRIVPVPAPPGTEQIRRVPNLMPLSAAEASERLDQFDLAIEFAGMIDSADADGVGVIHQAPLPGERVRSGDVVIATLGIVDR
ncbi:MAG: PASTA domain-containing protein [Pseudomonadota bacterium]